MTNYRRRYNQAEMLKILLKTFTSKLGRRWDYCQLNHDLDTIQALFYAS